MSDTPQEQKSDPVTTGKTTLNLNIPPVDTIQVDELDALKQRARLMGITFSNNIGIDALKEKINEKLNGTKAVNQKVDDMVDEDLVDQNVIPLNEVTDEAVLRRRMYEENMYQVRVRISNLNPAKKDIPGEWLTVNNKYLGTVRKYIPFGEATDNGYHVPKILLEVLKARKFLSLKPRRNAANGVSIPEQQWVKEFAIEELPPLTREELDQLARQQAAARGM